MHTHSHTRRCPTRTHHPHIDTCDCTAFNRTLLDTTCPAGITNVWTLGMRAGLRFKEELQITPTQDVSHTQPNILTCLHVNTLLSVSQIYHCQSPITTPVRFMMPCLQFRGSPWKEGWCAAHVLKSICVHNTGLATVSFYTYSTTIVT